MAKIITVSSAKGGVGKSTAATNIAGALSEANRKVLLIDMDTQANTSSIFSINTGKPGLTVFELLTEEGLSVKNVVQKTAFNNLDMIPASSKLRNIESHFAGEFDAQFILKDRLQQVKSDYDYILIDCPPSITFATVSSLICSGFLMIPAEAQDWGVQGITQVIQAVQKIKNRLNPDLQILGIIVNKFNSQRTIEKEHFELLKNLYGDLVFPMQIKVSVKYPEAVTARKPVNYYLPSSEQADTFRKIAEEVEKRCQK